MRLYLEAHKIGDDRVWGCLGVGQVMCAIFKSYYMYEAILLFAIIASWLGCWVCVCLGMGSLFCGYMHVCHAS